VGSCLSDEALIMFSRLNTSWQHSSWNNKSRPRQIFIWLVVSFVVLLMILLVAQPFFSKMMKNFERIALQQVITQLNIAANFKLAEHVALDKMPQLPEKLTENPIVWLDVDDLGGYNRYIGEVERLNFGQLDNKQWAYDRSSNRLVYKLRYPELLRNEDPVANRIQFRLAMDYSDLNENGHFDAKTDKVTGLRIVPEYPYRWLYNDDK